MTTNSPNPVDVDVQAQDYFASLVKKARISAEKAMTKFPQPNYVLNKVAEESGEVIKAVIHYTEGRETWDNVEAELIDNLAMLIRLVKEGDQVIGFTPPAQVQRLNATAQPDDGNEGYVKAFYEIASILGIAAQPNSPKHVFETVMKPKLQALAATAQPVSDGWVKCSERMPPIGKRVLIPTSGLGEAIEAVRFESNKFNRFGIEVIADYWMPLPAATGGQR